MKMDEKIVVGPSVIIKRHLYEAQELLKLKSEVGRLPSSNLKKGLLQLVDDWFDQEHPRVPDHGCGKGAKSGWNPPAWKQAGSEERIQALRAKKGAQSVTGTAIDRNSE